MLNALIVGSGPAAAAVALALARRPDVRVTVIDVGLRLESERQMALDLLSTVAPDRWRPDELRLVSTEPLMPDVQGLPQKRSYGSDFPFRDVGQMASVRTGNDVQRSMISAAYGGFSNVWGAQLMPYTNATFDAWPIDGADMGRHYRAVLDHVPLAGEGDDLARLFPLIGSPRPLPALSQRSVRVLDAYDRHRTALNRLGITVGKARLAFEPSRCARCGLCMTGCPYGLIYSASQTFDQLRRWGRVIYHAGLLAQTVEEKGERVLVRATDVGTGEQRRFEADRLYIACGALGSTRLVLGSLGIFDKEFTLAESAQFTLPALSSRPVADPRNERQFTLNQFNMIVALDERGLEVSQLHFYTYDPAFIKAMPKLFRAEIVLGRILERLTVAVGYLPSWASPRLRVQARPAAAGGLPDLHISRERPDWRHNPMLRRVLRKVLRAAPHLDLYPVIPRMILAGGGKSYHFGGSFPHTANPGTLASSDRLGRVGPWKRVHLVDAAVFPTVAATTFTFTIMANAHRIATESLELA